MFDDDIDFDRVVSDPSYRREVIAYLKLAEPVLAETDAGNSAATAGDAQSRP